MFRVVNIFSLLFSRLLTPALLSTISINDRTALAQFHSKEIASSARYSLPLASAKVGLNSTNFQAERKIIQELVIQDVVKIFKWMEEPDMTPIKLAAEIQGRYCNNGCAIEMIDKDIFRALASERYIDRVSINEKPGDTTKVAEVSIFLKSPWYKKPSPTEFLSRLSQNIEKPREEAYGDRECVRSTKEISCRKFFSYSVNLKNKFFRSSKFREYRIYVSYERAYYKKENIDILGEVKLVFN